MALIERLFGFDEPVNGPKLPVHGFAAVLRERARGQLTNAAAQAQVDALSGEPLRNPADTSEALALLNSITVAGNAQAQLNRAVLIDDVLLLAEARAPAYDTPAKVRARLGL